MVSSSSSIFVHNVEKSEFGPTTYRSNHKLPASCSGGIGSHRKSFRCVDTPLPPLQLTDASITREAVLHG